jgi:hypothetical protein
MGVYDEIKAAFRDIVSPEIRDLRGEVKRLDQKIDSMRGELVAEVRRVDARIDGVDRELRTAIDVRERLASLEARVGR